MAILIDVVDHKNKKTGVSAVVSSKPTVVKVDREHIFLTELKDKYHITPEQLREMMKIHYPEHLI